MHCIVGRLLRMKDVHCLQYDSGASVNLLAGCWIERQDGLSSISSHLVLCNNLQHSLHFILPTILSLTPSEDGT